MVIVLGIGFRLLFLLKAPFLLLSTSNFSCMEIYLPKKVGSSESGEGKTGGCPPAARYAEYSLGERIMATPLSPRFDFWYFFGYP